MVDTSTVDHSVPATIPDNRRGKHAFATLAGGLFRAISRMLPTGFRREYGAEMAASFDDALADARARGGARGAARCTWVGLTDLLHTAVAERRAERRAERAEHRNTHPNERTSARAARGNAEKCSPPTIGTPNPVGGHPPFLPGKTIASMIDQLLQDFRYALRTLAQRPGVTAAAMASLALGIGANVAIYSVVDAVLLRPVPLERPEELLSPGSQIMTYPAYTDFRDRSRAFSGIAAWDTMGRRMALRIEDAVVEVSGVLVSGNYFDVLGIGAAVGRTIEPADDARAGASPVAVISHGLWERQFAADPTVVGREVLVNGYPLTVIGVATPGFKGERLNDVKEMWIPLAMHPLLTEGGAGQLENRNSWWIRMMGRRAPGVTNEQALAELNLIGEQLAEEHPRTDGEWQFSELLPASSVATITRREDLSRFIVLIAGTVGTALLIACVNVSNLLLVRNEQRRGELGMRLALGATRSRVVRQMLTESALLAAGGGAMAVVVASWTFALLQRFQLPGRIDIASLGLGLRPGTLLLALALAGLTVVVFGTLPAWKASDPAGAHRRRPDGASGALLRDAMVAVQVALSLVLLLGGGLFVRSLINATVTDLGFDAGTVLVADIRLGAQGYDVARAESFYRQVDEGISALPGVESVSWSNAVPVESRGYVEDVLVEGYVPAADESRVQSIHMNVISDSYFETIGIALQRGRAPDTRPDSREVVVNAFLAERYWPGENPLGKRLRLGRSSEFEVVGVAATTKMRRLEEDPFPYIYAPLFFDGSVGSRRLAVRTSSNPATIAAAVAAQVEGIDPAVPLSNIRTWTDHMGEQTRSQQMGATLLGLFSLVSLVLAAVGIYGVVAFNVARRTRELGIRMALGARRADLLRLVLRTAATPLLIGIVGGVLLSLAAGGLIAGFLFEVEPHDPMTLTATVLATALVGLAAIGIPARRATAADPSRALRTE